MTDLDDMAEVLAAFPEGLGAGAVEARRQFGLADLSDEAVLGSVAYIWAAIVSAQGITGETVKHGSTAKPRKPGPKDAPK